MDEPEIRDPATYTGATHEISNTEARNLDLSKIIGYDEPTKAPESAKPTIETEEETTTKEVEDDDAPWNTDSSDSDSSLEVEDDDSPVELKSDDPEYLKQKATNETWKARRIEKELKAAKAELERYRTTTPAPKPEQAIPAQIQVNQEIPRHIQSKIKDNIDHIIFSDPEMIELANKEAEIKANVDKYETLGAYAEALTDIQTEFKSKHLAARSYIQQYNEQVRQTEQTNVAQIMDQFGKKVEAAKEQYPQIEKAVEYLNKNADKLHIEVRRALLMDDNAGELAWHLGSSRKAMDLLVKSSESAMKAKSVPVDALIYIGELRARIKSKTVNEPQQATHAKPAVPKVIKSSQSNTSRETPDDLMKWGKQAREGKVKLPWQ